MADRHSVPLLTLDSLTDRPVIVIKGQEYLLITNALLPPLDAHRVQRMSLRIEALMQQETLTTEEEQELDTIPDKMCRVVLEAPDDVQAGLTNRQRMDIIGTFATAPTLMPGMRERLMPTTPDRSIGETLSPDSSPATEATH